MLYARSRLVTVNLVSYAHLFFRALCIHVHTIPLLHIPGSWSFSHNRPNREVLHAVQKAAKAHLASFAYQHPQLWNELCGRSTNAEGIWSSWLWANSQHENATWHTHHYRSHDLASVRYLPFPVVSLTVHDKRLYGVVITIPAITKFAPSHARLCILFWCMARPSGGSTWQ